MATKGVRADNARVLVTRPDSQGGFVKDALTLLMVMLSGCVSTTRARLASAIGTAAIATTRASERCVALEVIFVQNIALIKHPRAQFVR